MNAPLLSAPRVEPFFFDAEPGTRFSLYHAPAGPLPPRGAILYVHPLGDELNRTRRMAALQARRFASLGYAVLQIDLFGCGDSCGDFNAARWSIWKNDLAIACAWLDERTRSTGPIYLWGLRLGGLLALDFAAQHPVDGLILWQPYLSGRTCINHFLRQRLIAEVRSGAGQPNATHALRERLLAQGSIDVAGYELAAALAQSIDACEAATLALPPCPIYWFASGTPAPARLAASAARLARRWSQHGTMLRFQAIDGAPFWSQGSQPECQALLEATSAAFAGTPP